MNLVDYTHPQKVPPLFLPNDRRSSDYYVRLDELPVGHPYHARDWALFRHPEWLEGGSAWVHSKAIFEDLTEFAKAKNLPLEALRPVVGSGDPGYDEALAQGLITFGVLPMVAELVPRRAPPEPTIY